MLENLSWTDVIAQGDVDIQATMIMERIVHVLDSSCPERTVRIFQVDPPWMTPVLKYLLNRRHRILSRNPASEKLSVLNNRITVNVQKAKADFRKRLGSTGTARWWQAIKPKFSASGSNGSVRHDVEALNSHFVKVSTDEDYTPPIMLSSCCSIRLDSMEVQQELDKIRKTSSGPSRIPFWVFKLCSKQLLHVITAFFQNCLSSQKIPALFKKELITPIPKTSKPQSANDYRPIAVTDVLARVFERIILRRYMPNVLKFLPAEQHGFRAGRSTVSALIDLHSKILESIKETGNAYVVTIDLTKAFDTIRHVSCIDNAINMEIDSFLVNLLNNFLCGRIRAVCNGPYCSSWQGTNRGVGQGTVQGPILYLIATAFIKIFQPYVSFADDTSIIFDGCTGQDDISCSVQTLKDQFSKIGLALNAAKTNIMSVPARRAGDYNGALNRQLKILGVEIDDCLKITRHILAKCKRASSDLFALTKIKVILCM